MKKFVSMLKPSSSGYSNVPETAPDPEIVIEGERIIPSDFPAFSKELKKIAKIQEKQNKEAPSAQPTTSESRALCGLRSHLNLSFNTSTHDQNAWFAIDLIHRTVTRDNNKMYYARSQKEQNLWTEIHHAADGRSLIPSNSQVEAARRQYRQQREQSEQRGGR